MSHDHHPPLHDVTKKKTASSVVVCWTVFTDLLLGNALIKAVKILNKKQTVSAL
jgi:hypothetical protein